jgi:hypothetical protein
MPLLVQVVPATSALAERMAPRLRAADTAEVEACQGWTPLQALLRSLELAPGSRALLFDGEPVAMWGVEPLNAGAGVGIAWLLGTDDLTAHPLTFWRVCKHELAQLRVEWPVLVNWIDARYEASLRWARRLGFAVDQPKPFGRNGALFCSAALVR